MVMGLRESIYWLCWLITYALMSLITVFVVVRSYSIATVYESIVNISMEVYFAASDMRSCCLPQNPFPTSRLSHCNHASVLAGLGSQLRNSIWILKHRSCILAFVFIFVIPHHYGILPQHNVYKGEWAWMWHLSLLLYGQFLELALTWMYPNILQSVFVGFAFLFIGCFSHCARNISVYSIRLLEWEICFFTYH